MIGEPLAFDDAVGFELRVPTGGVPFEPWITGPAGTGAFLSALPQIEQKESEG